MPTKKRQRHRPFGNRRYRKIFIISAEGTITEKEYFNFFNSPNVTVQVQCLKGSSQCSPPQVLQRLKDYLSKKRLEPTDEAWIVVDKDGWTDEQLELLYIWSQERTNFGFALSNPKFEYWLLLHFEDGTGITSSDNCSQRLQRHLPNYNKSIDTRKFTLENIQNAIRRAKVKDNPPAKKWPLNLGTTTVYKLVENILMPQNE